MLNQLLIKEALERQVVINKNEVLIAMEFGKTLKDLSRETDCVVRNILHYIKTVGTI